MAEVREGFPEAGAAAGFGVAGILQMPFQERVRNNRFAGAGPSGLRMRALDGGEREVAVPGVGFPGSDAMMAVQT